jgi:gamma-glutamyltranspeptidase/glutathione hydrolase
MRDFHMPGRSPVFAANGLCATSHPLAAKTAVQVLEEGGNAVDAAIAAAVLLGFCEPQMTGLGGDCFVLVKPAGSEEVVALNGSGRAPAALDAAALRTRGLTAVPEAGPEAVTVPGAVDAFCRLSARFGRWELARVLAPAIRYAEEGVPVAPRVAFDWAESADALQGSARARFLKDGAAFAPGQRFRAPGQAEVLRRIARDGRAAFYEGEVAEDMIAALRARGGVHTAQDFAAAEATWGEPVRGSYRGVELIEHPPNGQGAIAILLAHILSNFDLAALDPVGAPRAHLEAEATKLAYDARNRFLADPAHMARLDHLLSPETGRRLAALIDPRRAMPDPRAASEAVHRETIYLTVVDRDLMAVSLIYSIYHAFGSGIASDRFGLLLHNRGAGFTLAEGHPNEAMGGKRPLHTIIPAMIARGGRIVMPFGVMGGAYQATGHARFLGNVVDHGMDPQAAIDAPRAFADIVSGELKLERGYASGVRDALASMGHRVTVPAGPIGGAQAILIDHEAGVLQGGSDPRKDGCALGY